MTATLRSISYADYVQNLTAKNGSIDLASVDIYTHIITVDNGTKLTFLCGNCGTVLNCWYQNQRQILYRVLESDPVTVVDGYNNCDPQSDPNCTISQLSYTASFQQTGSTFYCVKGDSCLKQPLPICYNGTLSHSFVVQVDLPPLPSPSPSPPPSTTKICLGNHKMADVNDRTIAATCPSLDRVINQPCLQSMQLFDVHL